MAGDIVDFNMSDGIPPLLMQKLNSNFSNILGLIRDPEVNIVAGATEPSPRTDETLWYDTETGELSIWAQGVDPTTGQPDGHWGWKKLDLNIAVISPDSPNTVPPTGQFLWYNTTTQKIYVFSKSFFSPGPPRWYGLEGFASGAAAQAFFDSDGALHQDFVDAVKAAVRE